MSLKEEIQQEFSLGASIEEVCHKYKLSFGELMREFKSKPKRPIQLKYIRKSFWKYNITKRIEGKGMLVFGSYYDLNEAIKVRDELVALDWNADPDDYLGDTYIARKDEYYWVTMPKTNEYLEKFKTLDEAREFKDKLVECNWKY